MATGGSFPKLSVYSGDQPATRPDRRGGPAREKSELGRSGGRRPETESGLSSVSLLAPRLPGAPPGIGLGLKKRRNGRGRQQRPSRVGTAPDWSRGGPNPTRIIKQYGRDPPETRLVTMWGLLIWTLVALYRIRATGAQGMGGHPHVGWGRGGGGREPAGLTTASGTRVLAGAEPSPGSFRIRSPSLGALFRGMGRSC